MKVNLMFAGSALLSLMLLTGCGSNNSSTQAVDRNDSSVADQGDASPEPSPELTPAEVVRIQLEAIRKSDSDNSGIAIAYRFASPRNKDLVGPIERFELMLRDSRYASIMTYEEIEFYTSDINDDSVQQVVVLETADGETHCYLFLLSKQLDEPYRDCWMTDAVICEQGAG